MNYFHVGGCVSEKSISRKEEREQARERWAEGVLSEDTTRVITTSSTELHSQ
jgi:hypothetical protein